MGERLAIAFGGAKLLLGAVQTRSANRAVDRETEEAQALAEAQLAELERQREEADEIAQEQKSDRVREADRDVGALRARMAEVGGLGTVNLIRGIVDIGAAEGFDLARLETNRVSRRASLEQSKEITKAKARSAVDIGTIRKQTNRLNFLGSGLSVAASTAGDIRDIRRPTDARDEE